MSLLIVEPLCEGYSHVPTNSGFLVTSVLAFPDQRITFWAEKQHLGLVQQHLETRTPNVIRQLRWESNRIFDQNLRSVWHQRFLTLSNALRRAQEDGSEAIIFTALDGIGLFMLKGLLLSKFSCLKTVCIMHSVMAHISGPPHSLKSWLFRQMLLWGNHRLQLKYVVIAPTIYNTAIELLPGLASILAHIDHPHLFRDWDVEWEKRSEDNEQVTFGFIGGNTPTTKGFDFFKQLAQDVTQHVSNDRCIFTASGLITKTSDSIVLQPYLSERNYASWISSMDYLIFPYSYSYYSLRASACILDAFEFVRPCIFLRIPLFEDYFERMGNIGYLCDTYDQLCERIISLAQDLPQPEYATQCKNILEGRRIFEPLQLAPRLRRIVETC